MWRVRWCWIERTEQSEDYQAALREYFEQFFGVDMDDPMSREQAQQMCVEALDRARKKAEAVECWVGACVE